MRSGTFIFVLFLLLPLQISTQTSTAIDSIQKLIFQTHNVDSRSEHYLALSRAYRDINLDSAFVYAKHAARLSTNALPGDLQGKIYGNLGDLAIAKDSMAIAKGYYKQALTFYEEQNNIDGTISILTILGNIAFAEDNLSETLQLYRKGIRLADENNNQKRLNRLYLNIGAVLYETGHFTESKEYLQKALEAFSSEDDSIDIALAYTNLGLLHLDIQEPETAQDYFRKALMIYESKNSVISIANTLNNMASVEIEKRNYKEALSLLNRSKSLFNNTTSAQFEGPKWFYETYVFLSLGNVYLRTEQLDSASTYLYRSLTMGRQNKQLDVVNSALESLTKYWQLNDNADSALFYHLLFKTHSDSLFKKRNNRKLAYQEAQFIFDQQLDNEQKEHEKELEKSRQNIILLIITILILTLFLFLLVLFLRLNRIKMKKIELEQESLKTELELKNKELTTYLMYQVKNNEFVLKISEKLKKLLWNNPSENKQLVGEIIREIETDASVDNWEEFIIRFQQVHTSFYKNLGTRYPDLTSNELRLCAFLMLNMNTKDIAAITYQTPKSITVARSRLRQKLGLKKEEQLSAFLTQF